MPTITTTDVIDEHVHVTPDKLHVTRPADMSPEAWHEACSLLSAHLVAAVAPEGVSA